MTMEREIKGQVLWGSKVILLQLIYLLTNYLSRRLACKVGLAQNRSQTKQLENVSQTSLKMQLDDCLSTQGYRN